MKLTPAQRRVLAHLASGYTVNQTCDQLTIKRNTADVHIARAKAANGCKTIAQLTAHYAVNYGIPTVSWMPRKTPPPTTPRADFMYSWRESFKKHNK